MRAPLSLLLLMVMGAGSTLLAEGSSHLRVPSSLEILDGGNTILVGLERSGEIALLDRSEETPQYSAVAEEISGIAPVHDQLFVATDGVRHRALLLQREGLKVHVVDELKLPHHPQEVIHDPVENACWIASSWARTISMVEILEEEGLYLRHRVELPFEPGQMLLLEEERRLVVADEFGGKVAVLDLEARSLESVRSLPAHNIRDLRLSLDGERVLMTHQRLNANARTSFPDIHWGLALTNAVRALRVEDLLDPRRNLVHRSDLWLVGDTGAGAADPHDLIPLSPDLHALTLAGTDELAFSSFGDPDVTRLSLGNRPTAMVFNAAHLELIVANSLSDQIMFVDLETQKIHQVLSLSAGEESSARDRGERLFFSGELSHDRWMSCHSCHSDGHSNGLVADTFGDGAFGAAKKIPSLLGVTGTKPFGWLGNKPSLEVQLAGTLEGTMRRSLPLTDQESADLLTFVRSLEPPEIPVDSQLHEEGRHLFTALNCTRCHEPGLWTSQEVYDVGMVDELGVDQFNPPSLKGTTTQRILFHDGRAVDLEEALNVHQHQVDRELSEREIKALWEFLKQPGS